jgi:hypothetical protein
MSSPDPAGAVSDERGPRTRLRQWRLPILLVAMLIVMIVAQELTVVLDGLGLLTLVVGVAAAALTLLCYARLSKAVERRSSVDELSRGQACSGLVWGSVIGGAAFVVTMLIILAFGGWQMSGGDLWKFLATIGIMATAAATEEVVFRGIIFRIAEERFGTWAALAISAVLFGLVHLAGSTEAGAGAEIWGGISIALQGGLLLGAAYVATRSLWLPIGVHFAWNLVEAGFGTAVSGKSSEFGGLVHTTLSGSTVLTGGSFGPEAGIAAILTCLVAAALMLRHAARHGRIVHRGDAPAPRAALG